MPQSMYGGGALFDADGDGRLDILLLQGAGPNTGVGNRLYLQTPDGKFRDASAGSGLDFDGYNIGVAVGDVDNDGRPDVLITQFIGARLLRNEGGGKFRDITAGGRHRQPALGHVGRVRRLRPGRPARPDRRQLPRLRPVLAVQQPGRQPGLLRPADVPRHHPPAVPQPRAGGRQAGAVRRRDRAGRAGDQGRPRAGGVRGRPDRGRLAGPVRRQRRHAEPPLGEPEGRDVQERGHVPRDRADGQRAAVRQHGDRRRRLRRGRADRRVRHPPRERDAHPLAAGAGRAVPGPHAGLPGGPDRRGGGPGSGPWRPTSTGTGGRTSPS